MPRLSSLSNGRLALLLLASGLLAAGCDSQADYPPLSALVGRWQGSLKRSDGPLFPSVICDEEPANVAELWVSLDPSSSLADKLGGTYHMEIGTEQRPCVTIDDAVTGVEYDYPDVRIRLNQGYEVKGVLSEGPGEGLFLLEGKLIVVGGREFEFSLVQQAELVAHSRLPE